MACCNAEKTPKRKLKIINIGLPSFYEEVINQGAEAIQLDWRPPFKQNDEIKRLLDLCL